MIALWDWRRQVADLYTRIRAMDDAVAAWALWCAVRDRLFAEHAESPIAPEDRAGFRGIPVFAYDPALRFLVSLVLSQGEALRLDAGADGVVVARPFARTLGLGALGGELTLYWIGGYGGGVFLPFTDGTSGREAYGGGRYLLDTIKGADLGERDGRVVLDFNFAYAPSCAHSALYVCPLAPSGNRLAAAVRGGERNSVGRV